MTRAETLFEELVQAAKEHGQNSEPDHEAGDLIDMFATAWETMTPEQRVLFFRHDRMTDVLEGPEYADIDTENCS